MEISYNPNGPKGQQCGDCIHFKLLPGNAKVGTCFGHTVVITGTCNLFKQR